MKKGTDNNQNHYISAVLRYRRGKAREVEKALRRLSGIKKIEFDYPTTTVTVTFVSTLRLEHITRAVQGKRRTTHSS